MWSVVALFRDSIVDAIAMNLGYDATAGSAISVPIALMDSPATTSAVTYKIRVGPGAPGFAMRLNGVVTGRYGGGSMRATLILQEIKV
jgi:hypothetical protein